MNSHSLSRAHIVVICGPPSTHDDEAYDDDIVPHRILSITQSVQSSVDRMLSDNDDEDDNVDYTKTQAQNQLLFISFSNIQAHVILML